jgi:hypothetical protein
MNDDQPGGNRNISLSEGYRVEAVRQLVSGIAHEFANALSVIAGIAYFLRDELTLDRQSEEDLNEIRRTTEEAAFLARELMAFASNIPGAPTRRGLSEVVKQLRRLLPHVLPPQIRVEERLAPYDIVAWVDPQQTTELAIVIAVHARDALPRGGELLIQTTRMEVDREAIEITLPPGSYAALEIVASGSDATSTSGDLVDGRQDTSHVLADAAGVLKHTGGGLSVQRDESAGTTTFRMYLPLADDLATGRESQADQQPANETVLLLEDDEDLAEVVARMLRMRGYTVIQANNRDAALETAETFEGSIHVLLSDVVVPGTNGLELVRRLAAMRPDVRVLLMSGYAPPAFGEHLPFIRKPFSPEGLSQKLREVLHTEPPRPAAR